MGVSRLAGEDDQPTGEGHRKLPKFADFLEETRHGPVPGVLSGEPGSRQGDQGRYPGLADCGARPDRAGRRSMQAIAPAQRRDVHVVG